MADGFFGVGRRALLGVAALGLLSGGCALTAEQSLNAVAPTTIAPVTIPPASPSTTSLESAALGAPSSVLVDASSTSQTPSTGAVAPTTTVLDPGPAPGPTPTTVGSVIASVLAGPSFGPAPTTTPTPTTPAPTISFTHDASLSAACIAGQWTIGSGALTRYVGEVAPSGGSGSEDTRVARPTPSAADGTITLVVGPDLSLRARGLFTVTVNVGGDSRYLYDVAVDQSVRLRPTPDGLAEAAVKANGAAPVRITGARSQGPAPEGVLALEGDFSTFLAGKVGITCTSDRLVVEGPSGRGSRGSYHLEFSRVAPEGRHRFDSAHAKSSVGGSSGLYRDRP